MALAFLKKKGEKKGLVGVSLSDQGLSLAHVLSSAAGHLLESCELLEGGAKPRGDLLESAVARLGLKGLSCNWVLSDLDYNMLLVEAPRVQPEEMRQALRWRVKELIDWPVEDAVLDVFPVPEDAYRSQGKMIYVVVTRKARIIEVRDLAEQSGLRLQSIDIPELALRNLSSAYTDDSNGLAFIDLKASGSTLNLSRNGCLYLSRHLNTHVDPGIMDTADWGAVKERLVLEIQRSLDYYESQMGQSQISRVLIAPRGEDTQAMAAELNEAMAVRVETMDLGAMLRLRAPLSPDQERDCLPAIGGALRRELREAAAA